MCLYETKIKNIKYLPNKKNGGIAPAMKYKQLEYLKVGCGWCIECRKKIANMWRVRLYEEIKENKNCEFVTLSFSPESIKKLEEEIKNKKYRGWEGKDLDVNILASYAIRKFTERWRKKYKKAPRHWMVTELGHKNSERIHLHGIIFNTNGTERKIFCNDIIEKWKYGNVYIGEYVNEKTINYIVKYVTKLDTYHKGYKQAIFTSKGLGKEYITKNKSTHKFRYENTILYYKTYNGFEIELPRYYKEKLFTEEEREELAKIRIDKNETYLNGIKYNTNEENENKIKNFKKCLEGTRKTNEAAGYGNNETINKYYVITDIMKLPKNEIINYDKQKLVKSKRRRTIENIEENKNDKINKEGNKKIYRGQYVGDTTEAMREYNKLIEEANELKVSIRVLRLIKQGIIQKTKL